MATTMKTLNTARWFKQRSAPLRPAHRRPSVCAPAAAYVNHRTPPAGKNSQTIQAISGVAVPELWQLPSNLTQDDLGPAQSVDLPLYVGKHAVIAGAGPCGALSAMYLAQQGFTVDVFERRPPLPKDKPLAVGPRSFCIMLHRRGLEAIAGAGVKLPDSMCLRRGSVVRFRGTKMYTTEASPWSHSVNRDLLTAYLVNQAQESFPGKINFHFETQLDSLSLEGKTATFKSVTDDKTHTVPFDIIIGADGAHSRTRAQFQQQIPGFSFIQAHDDMEYKTTIVPPLGAAEPAPYFTLFDEERNAFFVCARDVVSNGQTRGVFVLNKGGFDKLKTEEDYFQALQASFPAPFSEEHHRTMARQLVDAPLSHGNLNTQCSQIWGPNGVLLGDAAHSMWPTLGQGVNSALEDAAVLSRVLRGCGGDLAAVPKAFHDARHADALAVVDLTWHSYGEGKHAISAVSIIKSMLLFWGSKLLPNLVMRPALSLMNETSMPYSDIKAMQERENKVLDTAAVFLGATAAALVVALPPAVFAPLATAAGSALGM